MTCALRGEKAPKERPRCPICDSEIRSYWFHFYNQHSKSDLARLVLTLLKIPKLQWHKRTY